MLRSMHGQHNLRFLAGLSKDAGSLQELIKGFRAIFDFRDSQIFLFLRNKCLSHRLVG